MTSKRPHISHYNVSVAFTDRKTARECARLLSTVTQKNVLIVPIWVGRK